ncbi:MAG: SPFH domain-containing protein [Candidatus Hodarchaeales archaeon]|jgi:regulator of protease activity HflC (stomatin/prohibitin superfamily)
MQDFFGDLGIFGFIIGFVILILIIMGILSTIRVMKEWERVPIFTLGRFSGVKGPGVIVRIPIIQGFGQKLDLRLTTFAYNSESSLTGDNVSVRVDAIMFYKIVNPETAILEVDNYHRASQWAAQTTLREVIGATELDTVLSHRDEVSKKLAAIIDHKTEKYGIKVTSVEIRDIILPGAMQEVMARQAIAEREKRARLTMASAENEASQMMLDAAIQYEKSPTAFVLRYWNILKEISENPGAKLIIMPSTPENIGESDLFGKVALGLEKTD